MPISPLLMYSPESFALPFEEVMNFCPPPVEVPEAAIADASRNTNQLLQDVLKELRDLRREVDKHHRLEQRFDAIERELRNNFKLELMDKTVGKLQESVNCLASDLKSFSRDIQATIKEPDYGSE